MNRDSKSQPQPLSIIEAYCVEFDRLATTLCNMLDVALRHKEIDDGAEWLPLRSLAPSLARLQAHLSRSATGGIDAPDTTMADAGVDDTEPALGAARIDEICRPAVEALVTEILDAGTGSSRAEQEGRASPRPVLPSEGGEPMPGMGVRSRAPLPEEKPRPAPIPVWQLSTVLLQELGDSATLEGSAESLPISALFGLLADSRSTGCLHLRTTREHLQFVFDSGQVVAAVSDNPPPGQRLGEILIRLKLIEAQKLEPCVQEAARTGNSLGSVLVVAKLISVEDLTLALQTQVHARFDRVLKNEHVAYAFVPGPKDETDGRLSIAIRQLLLENARRKDETARNG